MITIDQFTQHIEADREQVKELVLASNKIADKDKEIFLKALELSYNLGFISSVLLLCSELDHNNSPETFLKDTFQSLKNFINVSSKHWSIELLTDIDKYNDTTESTGDHKPE